MSITPGTSAREMQEEQLYTPISDTLQLSKLSIGEKVIVRVVKGPKRQDRVWVPILRKSQDGRTWKDSMTAINVDAKGGQHFFTPFSTAEKTIMRQHIPPGSEEKKLRSQFDPSTKYLYVVIPRNWDPDGKGLRVCLMEAPQFVYQDLQNKQKDPDPTNPLNLLHGPITHYDLVIEPYEDPNQPKSAPPYQKRRYRVTPFKNKFEGKLSVALFKDGVPDGYDWIAEGVLTEKEWEVLDETSLDIEELTRAVSHDEIMQQLIDNPINLYAEKQGNIPYFLYPEELAELLSKYRVPLLTEEQVVKQKGGLVGPVDGDPGTRAAVLPESTQLGDHLSPKSRQVSAGFPVKPNALEPEF